MTSIKLSQILLPTFHDFWKAIKLAFTFYIAKGGRNSAKSTHISIFMILLIISLPINGLAIRKVAATLQESVFEQLKDAIFILGVDHEFLFSTHPLRITYKERGNYILFRGADKPEKFKSIKTSQFPIAVIWVEELTEFNSEDELQVITDSILRAELPDGLQYKFFFSYNPPRRKQHWVNKKFESHIIPKNYFIHHSDYRGNTFLSKQTLEEIEELKLVNENKYRWNYLGEVTGGGIVPFENLTFRTITDEEYKSFDNIRQGIDWGYSVDPFAFVRWHYDKTRRKIFAMDEIYEVKLSNREASEKLLKTGYGYDKIICDSSEPKSIAELKTYGLRRVIAAIKGPGSVENGEKWLDDLDQIVIDPIRTPNIAKEFESIDYQVDRFGATIPKLEDKDNHTIDATRYAFENDIVERKITAGETRI